MGRRRNRSSFYYVRSHYRYSQTDVSAFTGLFGLALILGGVAFVFTMIHNYIIRPLAIYIGHHTTVFAIVAFLLALAATWKLGSRLLRIAKGQPPIPSDRRTLPPVDSDFHPRGFLKANRHEVSLEHYQWERATNTDGYTVLIRKNLEHRFLAERSLGRRLRSDEVVHHINGKKTDNHHDNLCVMNRVEHEQFHAWLKWKESKIGHYPPREEQVQMLTEKHNGILLSRTTDDTAELPHNS